MISDLTSWLVEHYGQERFAPDPDLSRMKKALGHLLPELQQSTRIVTIAGTNGKGETTLRLSGLLKDHSHCTWTSPHIIRLTERFRDERGEIDLETLEKIILECHERVQKLQLGLSFYEFLFFVFCTWAHQKRPEYLLLEVGLGGRLDAVNVFAAELVLLPSISRDHQELLGHRLDLILAEKLALLRPKSTLISFLSSRYLREKAAQIVQERGSYWVDLEESVNCAEFTLRNSVLARAAYAHLTGRSDVVDSPCLSLENRGDLLVKGGSYVFYGSHNVDGMRNLIQFLHSDTYTFSKIPFDAVIVAFSQRSERDLRALLKMLKVSRLGEIVVGKFPHPKAADPEMLMRLCAQEGIRFAQDFDSYVHGTNNNQTFLVTGSYYFLGHFKSLLSGR